MLLFLMKCKIKILEKILQKNTIKKSTIEEIKLKYEKYSRGWFFCGRKISILDTLIYRVETEIIETKIKLEIRGKK
jgi:hypothetical protein